MSEMITLRQAKAQCRLEVNADPSDATGGPHIDNEYLTHLIAASIRAFEIKANRILYKEASKPDPLPENALLIDPLIQQGILFLISHWYENREPVNIGNIVSSIPLTFETIVEPYRFFYL